MKVKFIAALLFAGLVGCAESPDTESERYVKLRLCYDADGVLRSLKNVVRDKYGDRERPFAMLMQVYMHCWETDDPEFEDIKMRVDSLSHDAMAPNVSAEEASRITGLCSELQIELKRHMDALAIKGRKPPELDAKTQAMVQRRKDMAPE